MKYTNGIIDAIKNDDSKPIKTDKTEFTTQDFHDIINKISEGKPTKDKPFYFIKGGMFYEGEEIGACTFKNDSEFLYVKIEEEDFKKIDHNEFHNNNIKYID